MDVHVLQCVQLLHLVLLGRQTNCACNGQGLCPLDQKQVDKQNAISLGENGNHFSLCFQTQMYVSLE